MSIIEAVIFGIVQGITEFIPVSSSGHLVLLHNWFTENSEFALSFDVALHLGTLLALLIYFRRDLVQLIRSLIQPAKTDSSYRLLVLAIITGTVPAVIIGYFFEDIINETFRSVSSVAGMLILIGVVMLVVDRYSKRLRDLKSISVWDGLLIGLAQALALIPGTSRSGITIITGLALKLQRPAAARFSFLLAIPIVFGAGAKKALDLTSTQLAADQIMVWLIGIVVAALFGWLAIAWLLKFLSKYSLAVFAWYRIVLGSLLLIFFSN